FEKNHASREASIMRMCSTFFAASGLRVSRRVSSNRIRALPPSKAEANNMKCKIGIARGASSSRVKRNATTADSAAIRTQAFKTSIASLTEKNRDSGELV